jgi:hypothetical protein
VELHYIDSYDTSVLLSFDAPALDNVNPPRAVLSAPLVKLDSGCAVTDYDGVQSGSVAIIALSHCSLETQMRACQSSQGCIGLVLTGEQTKPGHDLFVQR